jgi:hypothetical protein
MDASVCARDAGLALVHVYLRRIGADSLAVKEEGWRAGAAGDDAVEAGRGKGRAILLLASIHLHPLGGAEKKAAKRLGSAAFGGRLQQEEQCKKFSYRMHMHIDTNLA